MFNYETLFLSCVHCSFLSACVALALFTRPLMVFLRLILRQSSFHINRNAPIGFCTPSGLSNGSPPQKDLRTVPTLHVESVALALAHISLLFSGVGSWRCHTPVFVKIQDLSTRATPARFSTGTNPGGSTGFIVSGGETRMHASDLR